MVKFDNFSAIMLNLKMKIPFGPYNSPKKLISCHNEQQTHLQDRNTKVKFMSRILGKIYVGSETGSGFETNWKVWSVCGFEKNHSGSTTLSPKKKIQVCKVKNNKAVKLTKVFDLSQYFVGKYYTVLVT